MDAVRRIIHEAHRRSLWQVLAIYIVGAWVGYQVVLGLYEGIGLPSWVPGLAVVLFIIGLPIVLATAFVQEGHPLRSRDDEAPAVPGMEPTAATVGSSQEGGTGGVDERLGDRDTAGATAPDHGESRETAFGLFTWRGAITGGVLAFAVLGLAASGFMAMRSLGIGPAATLLSAGVLDERDQIVLADFQAPDSTIADLVTEALRIDLMESTALRLADPSYVAGVLSRMKRDPSAPFTTDIAREVAVREGLAAVIGGEVREIGGQYVLTATIRSAADGAVLAGVREDAESEAELIEAIDELSRKIREEVGESLRSVRRSEPLAEVTTSSLEALQLYSRAMKAQRRTGNPARAAELLEQAVAEDSTFAMAWRKLGVQLYNQGREPQRMQQALSRAYRLRERLPPRERLMAEGSYFQHVVRDRAAAAQAYRTLLELHPDHTPALNNLAILYMATNRLEEATELLRRALELEPSPLHIGNLAGALQVLGRLQAADSLLTAALRKDPEHQSLLSAAAEIAGQLGHLDRADSIARQAARLHPDGVAPPGAENLQGSTDVLRGRIAEAEQHYGKAFEMALANMFVGTVGSALAGMTGIALLIRRDTASAAAPIDRIVKVVPIDRMPPEFAVYAIMSRAYASVGMVERADSFYALDREKRAAAGLAQDRSGHAEARGLIALARGRTDVAIEELRTFREMARCEWCADRWLGLAYERAERPDSVIAAWTRAEEQLRHEGLIEGSPWRVHLLRRLGELHDARGDTQKALQYYTELLDLWSDPGPEVEPIVRRIRQRVEALTGGAGD